MKRIVALNSGGFDSVVMLHQLRGNNPDAEIFTIFFDYGQNNEGYEREKSSNVAVKLDLKHKVVRLPKIDWSKSNFYGEEYKDIQTQYLEYRNLIFLSYALSFAESVGADEIYLAILKSFHGYIDTSEKFYKLLNNLTQGVSNIKIVTPFIEYDKWDLAPIAYFNGILPNEYFSCDTPEHGEPCGKCPDCKTLREIEKYLAINTPAKSWVKHFDPDNKEFQDLIRRSPITEIRMLLNNSCQLKCAHCFYGFGDTTSPILPREVLMETLKEGIDLGVTNIHFSGKEPLINYNIFCYASEIKKYNPKVTFDVVTNGVTLADSIKMAELLKEYEFSKVFLSVDDVGDTKGVREVSGVSDKALKALNKVGMETEVFIDLHENNYNKVDRIITHLYSEYGVKKFYVRTLLIEGGAKDFTPLTPSQLNTTYIQLEKIKLEGVTIRLNLYADYVYKILETYKEGANQIEIYNAIQYVMDFANLDINGTLSVFPELYCGRYENSITLTPDGYVLGCASEVANPEYARIASGNIKEYSIAELIDKGKEIGVCANCSQKDCDGKLNFSKCTHFYD